MKRIIFALFAICAVTIPCAAALDPRELELDSVEQLEHLSKAGRYAEIFDSLSTEYRESADKKSWVKRSAEARWVITHLQVGTLAIAGDFADAPVKAKTVIGKRKLHIHSVIYLVRREGVWRLWNFPFAPDCVLDRPYWPPPFSAPTRSPNAA